MTIFGQSLMQHYFAASDGKRFLLEWHCARLIAYRYSQICMFPLYVRMLNVSQLLVINLCELLQIFCLFYSLCIVLQPHTTSQSEYRLRPVTQIKVAIMFYHPQYFSVIAQYRTALWFWFHVITPKIAYYPGSNLPHFGNHWVKCYNRVFA